MPWLSIKLDLFSYQVTPVYQNLFQYVKPLCVLAWETFLYFCQLELDPTSINIALDMYLMMLHMCTKNVLICEACHV